jgi:hypothetical protein
LQTLGDELELDLELVGTEVAVGPFSAHILAEDTTNGRNVVIKNHAKKLITAAWTKHSPTEQCSTHRWWSGSLVKHTSLRCVLLSRTAKTHEYSPESC